MKKNISAFLILNKSQEMAGVESMIIVEDKQAPVKTVDREKVHNQQKTTALKGFNI